MSPSGLSRALRALGCALLSSLLAVGPVAAETTTYVYDAVGRLIGAVDGSGKVVSYKYDNAGNRTQVSNDPFFAELLPASWTSSSTSGTSGLTTANGMRDGAYAAASTVHVTTSQAGPWIRAHFATPVYIDNTCVVPAAYGAMGPANVNGAVVEYSTDNGATWQSAGTVTGATAGVCTPIALRVSANSVRYRLTGTGQLAAGDIRFFSAGGGGGSPSGPVVTDKSLSVAYDTAGSVDLTPATGAWTSIAPAGTAPSKGTVSIFGSTATYTPISGQSGSDVFGYQATGPGGLSNIANVYVTIGQQAAPPTVSPVSVTMPQGQASKTFDLAPSGQWSSVQWSSHPTYGTGPMKGTASLSDTTVTYTPNDPNTPTRDFWYYTATGPGGTSAPAMVEVEILPAAPSLASSYSVTYNWNGGGQLYLWPTGTYTTVNIVSPPGKGTASIYPGSHVITYSAASNQSYTTSMQVQAVGPGGSSNIATVTITVSPPAAPVAEAKSVNVPANGSVPVTLTARVTSGDVSPTFAIASGPSHGSVSLSGNVATYTPTPGYSGADSFYYTASGLGGTGAAAAVSINVTQAPLAVTVTPSTTYNRNRLPTGWKPATAITVTGSGGSGSFTYAWEYVTGSTSTYPQGGGGGCASTNWLDSTPMTGSEANFDSVWRCKVTDSVSGQFAYSPDIYVHIYYSGNTSLMAAPSEEDAATEPAAESR